MSKKDDLAIVDVHTRVDVHNCPLLYSHLIAMPQGRLRGVALKTLAEEALRARAGGRAALPTATSPSPSQEAVFPLEGNGTSGAGGPARKPSDGAPMSTVSLVALDGAIDGFFS